MLRDFGPADQQRVRGLILSGLEERWGTAFDASMNPDLDDIALAHIDRDGEVIVIEL